MKAKDGTAALERFGKGRRGADSVVAAVACTTFTCGNRSAPAARSSNAA